MTDAERARYHAAAEECGPKMPEEDLNNPGPRTFV